MTVKSLTELKEKMDLSKRLPWVHKEAVWAFIIMLIILVATAVYTDGTSVLFGYKYIKCPESKIMGCKNPYYNPIEVATGECKTKICSKEVWAAGESYGKPPSQFLLNLNRFALFALVLAIISNFMIHFLVPGRKK